MRFMILVKADKSAEAGTMPSAELIAAMGAFNEEMVKAGVMLAGEGLHPSGKGARVKFSGAKRTVTDGPFPEPHQLVAGFWMIQVPSMSEAVEWATRIPFEEGEVEIRRVFEAEDFPSDVMPPEEVAREQRLRDEMQKKAPR